MQTRKDNGLRKTKTTANSTTTVYHYDLDGRLLSETDTNGKLHKQYLWHDSEPIAQINAPKTTEQLVYLHTDHLMTPRLGTNTEQTIVWNWSGDVFGSDAPGINTAEVNLRFPGQYYDAESGLHYNWNRYYEPTTGRYIASDPTGLDGGVHTYGYVLQNPLGEIDPEGLQVMCVGMGCLRLLMTDPGPFRLDIDMGALINCKSTCNVGFAPACTVAISLGGGYLTLTGLATGGVCNLTKGAACKIACEPELENDNDQPCSDFAPNFP